MRSLAAPVALGSLGILAACATLAGLDDYGSARGTGGAAAGTPTGLGGATSAGGGGAGGAGGGTGGQEDTSPLEAVTTFKKVFTGTGDAFASGLAVDSAADDAVFCGHFNGALTIDNQNFGSATDGFDAVVTRIEQDATAWHTVLQGTGDEYCAGVVVRPGETVVVGSFADELVVPPEPAIANGPLTVFLTELDVNGLAIAPPTPLGNLSEDDLASDVAEMPSGFAYAGTFAGDLSSAGGSVVATGFAKDAFVGHLFSSDEWLVHIDDPLGTDRPKGAYGVDANRATGRVVVAGESSGPLDVARPQPPHEDRRGYVMSFDVDGTRLWTRFVFGGTEAVAQSAAIDRRDDSTVVVGHYTGPVTVGSLTALADDSFEAFVVKLDASGNPLWLRTVTGAGQQVAWDVAIDDDGTIFVGGSTDADVDLGTGSLRTSTPAGFLWALSPSGVPRLGELITSDVSASVRLVATRTPSSVYVAAQVAGTTIDAFQDQVDLTGAMSPDVLLLRLAVAPLR